MGCPVNAKQGMLVTIPAAVDAGMLYTNPARRCPRPKEQSHRQHLRKRLGSRDPPQNRNNAHHPPQLTVSACGAINGPALFCAQESTTTIEWACVPLFIQWLQWERCSMNPFRVFMGHHNQPTHHFFDRGPTKSDISLTANSPFGCHSRIRFGIMQDFMAKLNHMGFLIAIHDDGIIDGDEGGQVSLERMVE